MALKDKKQWLRLFNSLWGYRPIATLRKEKKYNSIVSLGEILMMASDYDNRALIHVIFPFANRFPIKKNSKDCVVIFPQTASSEYGIFETEKPILYDGRLYSLDDFISKCPAISLNNADSTFGTYTFSLPYFLLETNEFNEFKKLYLTSVKKQIVDMDFYPESRGKGNKRTAEEKERKDFIIREFKRLKKKRPYPIKAIKESYENHLDQKYPDDAKIADKLLPNVLTVRRILDRYMKKKFF